MKPFEIIVVVNGSSDTTKEIAEGAGCRVVYYEEALGINIGRAIGAKKAKGDILLFCFHQKRRAMHLGIPNLQGSAESLGRTRPV